MGDEIMGFEGRIEYCEETVRGTPNYSSTMVWIGDVREWSIKAEVETNERQSFKARGSTTQRRPSSIRSGKQKVTAKIAWALQASSDIYSYMDFIALFLGTSTGVADAQKAFTLNCVHKEGTAEGGMIGSVGAKLQIKCGIGEDIMASGEVECISYDPSAPLLVTSDLSGASDAFEQAVAASGDILKWTDSEIVISGTTSDMVTDWQLDLDNRSKPRYRFNGSDMPADIKWGVAGMTGKIVFDFDSDTERLRMLAKTGFTLAIKIGEKTHTFLNCKWRETEIKEKPDDPLQVDMPFTATDWDVT